MKYAGMPFGMWTLFAASFRRQLTEVFGYDAATARAIALEPCGRNTAPAMTVAALHARHDGERPFFLSAAWTFTPCFAACSTPGNRWTRAWEA